MNVRPGKKRDFSEGLLVATVAILVIVFLALILGLIFWGWGKAYVIPSDAVFAVYPPAVSLLAGPWLAAGVLGGLIIRRPGAALVTEFLAATFSTVILGGTEWGASVLVSGLVQGLGAELIFLLFFYRRFGAVVAMLAGAGAGLGGAIYELFNYYDFTGIQVPIFAACYMISGAVIAGLGSWLLVRALAKTGALDIFGAGREAAQKSTKAPATVSG